MSYQDLIARLEKATGPAWQLDADIAVGMGWALDESDQLYPWANPNGDLLEDCPHYTASIDAALTLVPEGWTRFVDATAPECLIDVELFAPGKGPLTKGSHRCESIALCIAALKARQALTSAKDT